MGLGKRALTPHKDRHAAGAGPEGNGGQGERLKWVCGVVDALQGLGLVRAVGGAEPRGLRWVP